MYLKYVISRLKILNPELVVENGFGEPMSWRGDYVDLAFKPAKNVTIGSMLEYALSADGGTYEGYKGGSFTMTDYSDCYVAEYGEIGESIDALMACIATECILKKYEEKYSTLQKRRSHWEEEHWTDAEMQEAERRTHLLAEVIKDLRTLTTNYI